MSARPAQTRPRPSHPGACAPVISSLFLRKSWTPLLQTTTSSAGAITRLTATRGWDTENRLKTMTNVWTGGSQSRDTTLFDARSRRKTIAWDDGSKWDYG